MGLAACCPFTTDGLKRHFLAAAIAARSRSRLRLDLSTDTSTTLPLASTSMIRITVPSMPARTADGGYLGGFMFFDEISTLALMFCGVAGGAGGAGGGAGVSIGEGASNPPGGGRSDEHTSKLQSPITIANA